MILKERRPQELLVATKQNVLTTIVDQTILPSPLNGGPPPTKSLIAHLLQVLDMKKQTYISSTILQISKTTSLTDTVFFIYFYIFVSDALTRPECFKKTNTKTLRVGPSVHCPENTGFFKKINCIRYVYLCFSFWEQTVAIYAV